MSGHDRANRELVPGAIFDGAYQIMSPLGAGGMASVYLVRHLAMDKELNSAHFYQQELLESMLI